MPMSRNALLLAAGLAVLSLGASSGVFAQQYYEREMKTYQPAPTVKRRVAKPTITHVQRYTPKTTMTRGQPSPTTGPRVSSSGGGQPGGGGNANGGRRYRGGYDGGGRHHNNFGRGVGIGLAIGALPGIINAMPRDEPPPGGGRFIDDGSIDEPIDHARRYTPRRPPPRRTARRGPSGAPPAGETRLVPDEVVIELANSVNPRQVTALQNRFRLQRLESHRFALTGTTFYRWRIPDRRSVAAVVRALESDRVVTRAQPNYLYSLQQSDGKTAEGDPAQYALAKLHLPEAHALAKGDNVRVAVIDSAIDLQSPELADSIAGSFDTLKSPRKAHAHGTAIAALIAAHGKLMGAAPGAKILAVRAFDPDATGAQGSTFNIITGLDWAVENRARIINMSFAGPPDPALQRALEAAYRRGVALIAAAGNAGPQSPPLYPAAYSQVIAVSATDANDKLLAQSNRGRQIALAAPGKDILVALPDGGVEVSSGTSYSAAEVSGVAALLIERDGKLTPGALRHLMETTAKDLGPKGRDRLFGYGLVNAYEALTREPGPVAQRLPTVNVPLPVSRVNAGAR